MHSVGISNSFVYKIVSLLCNRKIYLKVGKNLLGPPEAQSGLPQGDILSPLLYAVYVCDIENCLPEGVSIIQFADDICIYATFRDENECKIKLDLAIESLEKWSKDNCLTISREKSVACAFTRKRKLSIGDEISVGSMRISCKPSVKFLGVFLDRKLNWTKHIKHLVDKVEKYVNVLRMVTNLRWGADPSTAMMFYRVTIRAILDYGAIFYDQASQSNLKKVDVVQHRCLRLCYGLLKSTPIDVILSESGELPLSDRRKLLADKYLLNINSYNPILIKKVSDLNFQVLTFPYWNKKKSPVITNSFTDLSKYNAIIYNSNKLPQYTIHYQVLFQNVSVSYFQFDREDAFQNERFLEYIDSKWPESYLIFTDGSKMEAGVGCAFYDHQINYSKELKLPDQCSIFTAELIAIAEALKYLKNVQTPETILILSDSKSALLKLQHITSSPNLDINSINILERLHLLTLNGKKVHFISVKAHVGIKFNEKVDSLAKKAVLQGRTIDIKIPFSDLYSVVKKNAWLNWQEKFQESTKGLFYKSINPKVRAETWHNNLNLNKNSIRILTRLRSNHGLCRSYLNRIGIESDSKCQHCNEVETLEHIVMICSHYEAQRKEMFKKLERLLPTPFNYKFILSHPTQETAEILTEFFDTVNRRV